MALNLKGVEYFDFRLNDCLDKLGWFPLNARIITLPTRAFLFSVSGVFDNISKTFLYGVGGIISFNATLLLASAKCALSTIIDPIALLVLGISSFFMPSENTIAISSYINTNYGQFKNPPSAFGPLTGRIMVILKWVPEMIVSDVKMITRMAMTIINKLGECVSEVLETILRISLDAVSATGDMVSSIFSIDSRKSELNLIFNQSEVEGMI